MNHFRLAVAVATKGADGIKRLSANILPPLEGVKWIVSWQESGDIPIPDSLIRNDVEIRRFHEYGLSRNRNNSILDSDSEIILIADDDVEYSHTGLQNVINSFSVFPDMEVACFKVDFPFEKKYPENSQRLGKKLPKGYSVASIEMAFRCEVAEKLKFHPLLGLGSPEFHGGEDEFFILQCIQKGLNCRFVDITICRHPGMPTGNGIITEGMLRASGCLIVKAYPFSSPFRIFLKAIRLAKNHKIPLLKALCQLTVGAIHSYKISDKTNTT